MPVGGEGLRTSSTEGRDYRRVIIAEAHSPIRVIPPGITTGSVAVRAGDNEAKVYIGWDNDVTVDNGFPMYADEVLSLDIDSDSQSIWVVGEEAGDEVRVIATN